MKKVAILAILSITFFAAQAQEETLGKKITSLTFNWDLSAISLNDYEGLSKFCKDVSYRTGIITLLEDIHHYDSILYDRLVKASRVSSDKEIKKALAEIKKFEADYSMKQFIHFLHDECRDRNKLEKNSDDRKSNLGEESYDGQIYIIETELNNYIKHITKRVDHVKKHVEHLHIK